MRATRLARRFGVSTVVAGALLVTAAAGAQADEANLKDRASDVVSITDNEDDEGTRLSFQDSIASGVDLRGMRVRHGNETVSIRLKFARLDPRATVSIPFRLDGKARPGRFLFQLDRRRAFVLTDQLEEACSVPLAAKTGTRGTITVSIKRTCLGDPERIKVAAYVFGGDIEDETAPAFIDVLSPRNLYTPTWTTWLSAG